MMAELHRQGTQAWHLVLAWGFVGIPLAWGVAETITNALKIIPVRAVDAIKDLRRPFGRRISFGGRSNQRSGQSP